MSFAPYAVTEKSSRGRRQPESAPLYRSEYQRDRDRIVHSSAFRRLEYKTQVFVNHEGDMFRTRLTHSIEVAQIGRATARALGLNEDLTEAISLAHDLGHTPFGHAGQDALNRCMQGHGGFEHNLQSLRVVDELEQRYADFTGLNLTFETREGILKHCSRANAEQLGDVGERFLTGRRPALEAQIANVADAIAYNNHDVDDGLRAGLITIEQLCKVTIFANQHQEVLERYPGLEGRRLIHEIIRRMINHQVVDLLRTSKQLLAATAPADVEAVRDHPEALIRFSATMQEEHLELKRFLHENLYRHYRVHRMSVKAQRMVQDLFNALFDDPRLLPPEHQNRVGTLERELGESGRARAVADYIAGMTDRFAISEHQKLFRANELT
ncbi:MAG: deoxyguanosinetriphosphate triphosphohydrolase [Gammaproteobacteria bacterium]|nr:deoxyguanosinetriphosphate triphosphohydrolase [Gammaproteobacteria bacterium]MCW8840182.1 deoxyguanosinetriphosphate triphosphohydrolase [Gammaproteobacteria bacterium]MCW8928129.1 deoxyguanosinetriphosphate triphosphohydrolase [Gammaproteobacteria bacterium]MCW8959510.1 deoxyguanosinetriphosphate triphosphohydrolase [Gammaproteobacteria bacterium]MCW8972537.1 deoxyguanosinetriphosphate triphosphohydrolase [Gammaproteobacteria bacterium]